jgi:hypothetical protein
MRKTMCKFIKEKKICFADAYFFIIIYIFNHSQYNLVSINLVLECILSIIVYDDYSYCFLLFFIFYF